MGSAQMILSGGIRASASITALNDFDMASGTVALSRNWGFTVDSSATAKTSDLIWQQEGAIDASGSVTVDLAGSAAGDPKDYWGADARFDRVHAILVKNVTAGAGEGDALLEIGGGSDGAGANAFGWFFGAAADTLEIAPGGVVLCAHGQDGGWAVADSSADILRLSNLDATKGLAYQIVVIGESEQSAATTTTTAPA